MGTGIAGFLLALWNNHRVGQIRRVDHWRDAINELMHAKAIVDGLPEQIEYALRSRRAVSTVVGRTGRTQLFETQCGEDLKLAKRQQTKVDEIDPSRFDGMSIETLAKRRSEVAEIVQLAEALKRKYARAVAEDDNQRDHIRADLRHSRSAEPPRNPR